MSKERDFLYICENCDRETDAGYFDKETGQTLCRNCFTERQRSFKDQRIADLEAKLAEKKQELSDRETKWAKWNKKDRIEFAIEMLSELERILYESHYTCIEDKYYLEMEEFQGVVNQQIKQLNASNSMPLEYGEK